MELQPSSYYDYLKLRKTEWLHSEEILSHFSNTIPNLSYETFVKEDDENNLLQIEKLVIEE